MTDRPKVNAPHRAYRIAYAEVLNASDAAGVENATSFEDWCEEYGYDTDSRCAERTFKACKHATERLKNFLGNDLYETLLWKIERS